MNNKRRIIDDQNLNDILFSNDPKSEDNLDEMDHQEYEGDQEGEEEVGLQNYRNQYDEESNTLNNASYENYNSNQFNRRGGDIPKKNISNQSQVNQSNLYQHQSKMMDKQTQNIPSQRNNINNKQATFGGMNKLGGYIANQNNIIDSNVSSATKQIIYDQQKITAIEMFQQQSIHNNLYGIHDLPKQQQQQQQNARINQIIDSESNKNDEQDQQIANVINEIPCPLDDFSMTSNSNNSTPQKVFPMNNTHKQLASRTQNKINGQRAPHFSNISNNNFQDNAYYGNQNLQNESNIYDGKQEEFNNNQDYAANQNNYHHAQEEEDEDGQQNYQNFNYQNNIQQKQVKSVQNNKYPAMSNKTNNININKTSNINNDNNQDWTKNIIKTASQFPEINMPTMELSNENSAIFSQYNKNFQAQPSYQEKLEQNRMNLKQFQNQISQHNNLGQHFQNSQKIDENEGDESSYQQSNQKTISDNNFRGGNTKNIVGEGDQSNDISQNNINKNDNYEMDDNQLDECEEIEDPRIFQYQQNKQQNNPQNHLFNNQPNLKVEGFPDQEDQVHDNFAESTNQYNMNYQDNSQMFDQKSNFDEDRSEIHQKVAQSLSRINQSIAEKQVGQLQSMMKDKDKNITALSYEKAQLYERINEIEEKFSLLSEKYKAST